MVYYPLDSHINAVHNFNYFSDILLYTVRLGAWMS